MRSRIMSKHAYLTIPIAIALLIVCPSLTRAQAQPAITVQFQDASLAQVAQAFASLSGLTIAVKNVERPRALGQILEAHDLVARLDASGAFRIERRAPSQAAGGRLVLR